ncbi:trigger factor [Dokdonia sp. Hel_I_53]|uniref:trigger factor n=1 Tax=Dokdonia sp. Hel_I_53 TaxID=1566287 RepID=UPI00119B4D26|nr:trigger factor [Dokdonia sp. Hel_I_53]TVZ52347.1 trigger factor [Dokdonia sp. Hel_I_53]
MNITKEQIDDLNAVVKVEIVKEDYNEKVESILKNYRKTANIPGFRKGHVPMGMVKKQYGMPVRVDEVNKLIQEALSKFLNEEKLDVLGNPLPKNQEDFNWDSEDYSFEFELGLAPKFDVNLSPKKAITSYKIKVDDKMVDNQITTIRKQYGKIISQTEVGKDSEVSGTFLNEQAGIDSKTTFEVANLKGKKNVDAFVGAKPGDVITLKTKGLFSETSSYQSALKISEEEAKDLNAEVAFTLTETNKREPADLDQELFDKLFGKDAVKSVTELEAKIKEDGERQFVQQSDQQLMNDVTERLIDETKFDLPSDFLSRWIQSTGEKPMTEEEAKEEFTRSEKGLRWQLIEGKLIADNKLQVTFEELKEYAKEMIKSQMMQYGQMNPEDKELDDIAARILGNQEEVKRLSEQLMNVKMLSFFKENMKLKEKEVTFDEFVKEVYN